MYVSSSCTCTDLINSLVCGPFGVWSIEMLKWIDETIVGLNQIMESCVFGALFFTKSLIRHRLMKKKIKKITYRPLWAPSTCVKLPLPDTTATRSLPLNHFTECKFPHDWTSIGHSSATVWPRDFDIVLSVKQKKTRKFE